MSFSGGGSIMRRIIYVSVRKLCIVIWPVAASHRGCCCLPCPWQWGTRVALAYALAGPVGVNGIWAAIPIGWFLADAVGYGYYFLRRRALLPGERETADSRNQKERCVTYELHPICWTVWYTVQQMGCVYMPKGIPQNQIKTKRPEPCAVQDSDRSGRLILVFV